MAIYVSKWLCLFTNGECLSNYGYGLFLHENDQILGSWLSATGCKSYSLMVNGYILESTVCFCGYIIMVFLYLCQA